MKPVVYILIISFLFAGCSKDVNDNTHSEEYGVITKALEENDWRGNDYDVSISDVRNIITRIRPSSTINDIKECRQDGLLFAYIVNYDQGWSIISADKRIMPVLAYSDKGHFDYSGIGKSGVSTWFNDIYRISSNVKREGNIPANVNTLAWEGVKDNYTNEEITELLNASRQDCLRTETLWTKIAISDTTEYQQNYVIYQPLIETEWGQGFPWNVNLVNGGTTYPTGCVAVALAQLLYFYNNSIGIPSGLYHNISVSSWLYFAPVGETPYYMSNVVRSGYTDPSPRWDSMTLLASDYYLNPYGAEYVADLMTDIGNRVNMRYYNSLASGSTINDALSALPEYGLTANLTNAMGIEAINDIQAGKPIYVRGYDAHNNIGHAWVADGLTKSRYKTTTHYVWLQGYNGYPPTGICATQEEANEAAAANGYDKPEHGMESVEVTYSWDYIKFHYNWGQYGDNDGYYSTGNPVTFNGIAYTFSDNKILYNIRSYGAQ